jgi:hypothetical protein
MPDRHDICACSHERVEHGSEAGEGCTVIVDARRIGDERCRCERFAATRLSPDEVRRLSARPPASLWGVDIETLCDSYLDVCEENERLRDVARRFASGWGWDDTRKAWWRYSRRDEMNVRYRIFEPVDASEASAVRSALSQGQGETGG